MNLRDIQYHAANQKRYLMAAFAVVIIGACLVFVTWSVWPRPDTVIPPSSDPAAVWTKSYNSIAGEHAKSLDAFYRATARISTEPTPDNQGIIVKGSVSTAEQLDLIKAEMAKVTPAVPIDWQVKIAR